MKRVLTLLLGLLVILSVSIPAWAAENIDPSQAGTVEVRFALEEGTDLTGMQFDLYRVAQVQADGGTRLAGDFASLDMDVPLTPSEGWADAASNAANLVRRNGLTPAYSACLDEKGTARFPEVLPGIYLVLSQEFGKITCVPTLAALPMDDGGWNYNILVKPKGGETSTEDYLEVLVIWDDKGFESQRPGSVLVDLYCDDVLVDTQEITPDMQWQYRWEPMPVWDSLGKAASGTGSDVTVEGEHSWYVVERGADNYEKSYALGGSRRIVITNTIRKPSPPATEDRLPQTGALWWPIPVLVLAGLCLIYLGRAMAKGHGKKTVLAKCLLLAEILLLVSALVLGLYNLWDDQRAARQAETTAQAIQEIRQENRKKETFLLPQPEMYQLPIFEEFPDVEMPVLTVEDTGYIGTLEIPSKDLSLPIIEEWNYPDLKKSPCRYSGSAYTDDLILCGHNYTKHFGCLASLEPGTALQFTDCDGNVFDYTVTEMEILQPEDTQAVQEGDWDLTLFTCTIGGKTRVTVRCARQESTL